MHALQNHTHFEAVSGGPRYEVHLTDTSYNQNNAEVSATFYFLNQEQSPWTDSEKLWESTIVNHPPHLLMATYTSEMCQADGVHRFPDPKY